VRQLVGRQKGKQRKPTERKGNGDGRLRTRPSPRARLATPTGERSRAAAAARVDDRAAAAVTERGRDVAGLPESLARPPGRDPPRVELAHDGHGHGGQQAEASGRQIPMDRLGADLKTYSVKCAVRGCHGLRICGTAANGGSDRWHVSVHVRTNRKCYGDRLRQRRAALLVVTPAADPPVADTLVVDAPAPVDVDPVAVDAVAAEAVAVSHQANNEQDNGVQDQSSRTSHNCVLADDSGSSSEEEIQFFPAVVDAEPAAVRGPGGLAQRTIVAVANVFRALSPIQHS
jgi:hypothetical protein